MTPSYQPDKRQNLSGEQLRNRALTVTFEPGSTMKAITVDMTLEAGRITVQTIIDTTPGCLIYSSNLEVGSAGSLCDNSQRVRASLT